MTPGEMDRAIAEHLGLAWYAVEKGGWYYRQGGRRYTNRIQEADRYTKEQAEKELVRGEPMRIVQIPYPNYHGDLNAMHEAEKTLTNEQLDVYCNILHKPYHGVYWAIHATAAQRAEAFLRTIGKWRGA